MSTASTLTSCGWKGSWRVQWPNFLTSPCSIHPHAFGLFGRNQVDVRRELENASQIVTISSYHQAFIAELCPNIRCEDIEVVHCGIEVDLFQPARDGSVGKPITILSVGRYQEKKGFEYLIDACALLAERGVDFQCGIAGGGTAQYRQALQARIDQHNLQNRVTLLGPGDQTKILELYRTSEIFALPCVVARSGDRDGIPVVLMEAMACELPVVSTDVAGIPDLVRDDETGLLVSQRDALSLANALERLITDRDLRQRLGKNGRQEVQKNFDLRHTAASMARIFHEVIQRKDRHT